MACANRQIECIERPDKSGRRPSRNESLRAIVGGRFQGQSSRRRDEKAARAGRRETSPATSTLSFETCRADIHHRTKPHGRVHSFSVESTAATRVRSIPCSQWPLHRSANQASMHGWFSSFFPSSFCPIPSGCMRRMRCLDQNLTEKWGTER